MSSFEEVEWRWVERFGNLRNVIRQEMIARQLGEYVTPDATVLDVGCGQGTQALRLATTGCHVTGLDPSSRLLSIFSADARAARVDVEIIEGRLEELDELLAHRVFDVVCAHGLLMYLDDRPAAIRALAGHVAPGGRLSITVRNAHGLAFRPGMRRRWEDALAAFDTSGYRNELGVMATADRLEEIEGVLIGAGLEVVRWFGVRVFNDAVSADAEVPPDEDLALLLDAEERAGREDPYRWLASQLHVIANSRGR
jgi:SAM-dependent methyltransferase